MEIMRDQKRGILFNPGRSVWATVYKFSDRNRTGIMPRTDKQGRAK